VRFQFQGQRINEHEAHAIFLMQWKERRMK
jgi:hypothetical protein